MNEKEIAEKSLAIFWQYAEPWILPSALILIGSYAAIFIMNRFFFKPKKRKMPDELKAAVPCIIGIIFQLSTHHISSVNLFIWYAWVGFANGAIVSSLYDMAVRRVKKKIHGEKDDQ